MCETNQAGHGVKVDPEKIDAYMDALAALLPADGKTCRCHTCHRDFHPLGIMSHRAAHRRRHQNCQITFTNGLKHTYFFQSRSSREPLND